jgi:hypothetical protein
MSQRSSLPSPPHARFFSRFYLFPEPQEQLTYLVLLTAPLLLVVLTIASARWGRDASSRLVMVAATTGQVLLLVLLLACVPAQIDIYGYFSVGAVVTAVAAGLAAAAVVVAGPQFRPDNPLVRALQARGRLTRAAAATCATIASLLVTTGLYTDSTISAATPSTIFHLPFTSEEYAAVLNGATPLVDFIPQYNFTLPYLFAPLFQLVGGVTTASFTVVMTLFSLAAMLAVYVALRWTSQNPIGALFLFLAFVAISLCPVLIDAHRLENIASYYALMPMRYGLPLLMAPAVVAAATGSRRASVLLAVLAAFTLVNNLDFGLPAFGAVLVSFWCQARLRGRLPWREISYLLTSTLVAVSSIAVLARARTGSWPDFGRMLY